jgi:NitT/TauT family transport system permease protein
MNHYKKYLIPSVGALLLVLIWHITVKLEVVPQYILPTLTDTIKYIYDYSNVILNNTLITFSEALLGMIFSVLIGYILAVLMHAFPLLRGAFYPHILWLRALPVIAIAPLITLYLGNDISGKVFIAFFISFFSVVVSSLRGLDSVPDELLAYFKLLGATKIDEYIHLRIPFSVPYLFVGAKIAASIAVIGALVGEFVGSNKGLGYLIIVASHRLEAPAMVACIIISGGLTLFLYSCISIMEFFATKRGYRGETNLL